MTLLIDTHFGPARIVLAAVLLLASQAARVSAQTCAPGGVSVQILGSNGPRINPGRASASYLLWVDGKARMLVDAAAAASCDSVSPARS